MKKTQHTCKCGNKFIGGTTAKYCPECIDDKRSNKSFKQKTRNITHIGYCKNCTTKKFNVNPLKEDIKGIYHYLGNCMDCGKRTIIWITKDLKNTSRDIKLKY